jgi:amidase
LTSTEAAKRIAAGHLRSEELVRACLEHIEAREPEVAAWQSIDPEAAITQARLCDRERERNGKSLGLLHGVPVAFKDVVDTADLPTTYGSAIYRDHRPTHDAACVTLSRRAGAVIMGKTVTTEFAARHPGKTSNPHDRTRTPGGSSSGSAAAVADHMVPLATGTQTVGSMIRPAAYCGIYGYKPSFGLLSFVGIKHLSETFDTLGLVARSLDDLALFRAALLGLTKHTPPSAPSDPPRIALCRTPMWDKANAETHSLIEDAAHALDKAGARVEEVTLADDFTAAEEIIWSIVHFEMGRNFAEEYLRHRDGLSGWTRATIEAAQDTPLAHYLEWLGEVERLRGLMREPLASFDAVMTPAAPGPAPKGLTNTGPPTFQAPWHLLQMPAVSLPAFVSSEGMPIGLQLVGQRHADHHLLDVARWVERKLN